MNVPTTPRPCRGTWSFESKETNVPAADSQTLPDDSGGSLRHISYLRLPSSSDQGGRGAPFKIIKLQETSSRNSTAAKFSVVCRNIHDVDRVDACDYIASCSVYIEADEYGQLNNQMKFSNDGMLVVSGLYQDLRIDDYVMGRVAQWVLQMAPRAQFLSATLVEYQTSNDFDASYSVYEPYRFDVGAADRRNSSALEESETFDIVPPNAKASRLKSMISESEDLFQELDVVRELNARAEIARNCELDRLSARNSQWYLIKKLANAEAAGRRLRLIVIVQTVAVILLAGYIWPIFEP
jgi:hypothetical protein